MKTGGIVLEGLWWRFSEYEIRGRHIRPAPGARLERYRPYNEIPRPEGREEPPGPHEELANLDLDNEADILGWVNRWGLLGVLPHQLEHAEFAHGVRFVRTPTGWKKKYDINNLAELALPKAERATLHPAKPPGVGILADWYGQGKKIDDVQRIFDRYFPDGMPEDGYPSMLSDQFWHLYAEPLEDFQNVVTMVRNVLRGYSSIKRPNQMTDDEKLAIVTARQWLRANASIRPDTPLPDDPDQRITALVSPSLIATLATLIWLDWGGNRTVRTCSADGCSNLFVTNLYNRAYCSERCRKRTAMRRYRQKERGENGQAKA